MAERWEVVFDFSSYAGKNITLRNNRDVQADDDYNSTDKVMKFVVATTVADSSNNGPLPAAFAPLDLPPNKGGVDRTFRFERSGGQWVVNGVAFSDVKKYVVPLSLSLALISTYHRTC
jgi:bilirubin oxidase